MLSRRASTGTTRPASSRRRASSALGFPPGSVTGWPSSTTSSGPSRRNRIIGPIISRMSEVLASGREVGRYRLERLLGEGATGLVYAATSDHGLRVALKLLRPE